ncbi:Retrovirus-related Pol polyprotein from transposon RE1 (Retro element 1) (AtRE1) [Includes: Protease RE1 [Durusdinium trenchii]|uniref:Retrovirus-related Pol polyprotein from transposon RE1 (Retro element 1) (AtRE1) n=1 Tax=Durusdinium trenchii TaxID=1381693 RepID=A0ABP0RPY1_9DINO
MADEKDSNAGAWSRVPTWDGSPQTWRSFRKDMSWWLAGLDIQSTKKYNLAARWLLRQSGVVRQRGEEFDPAELEYQKEVKMPNAETGDDEIVTPEDPLSGINRLLRALEEMTGRTSLDKRGELRNVFYLELKRRSGERISEFATRFRGLIAEMKSEGVTIHDGELGWWFKQKLGLDPLRTQLLDTALAGAEDYSTIECEVLRLFKDLHSADPLHRRQGDGDQRAPLLNRFLSQQANASRPSSYAPSMASSAARSMRSNSSTASSGRLPSNTSYRKPFMQKQAMVSEAEEEIHVDEQANEPPGGDDEMEPQTLEEVLTTEAEVLAAELDEAAAQGVDADTLQEIEESVEAAAEAFLTMKEARSKLQEVRKDRGYGKAPSPASSSVANKVNLKKQSDRHPCFDCGLAGHWAGDPECQKPGQQLGRKKGKAVQKQVKVTEALNTEHTDEADPEHEVLVLRHQPQVLTDAFVSTVQNFHEPKEVNALGLALDKRLVGALDSLGSQKWRRFGLDGILEVQSSFERWVHRRLKMVDGPRSSTPYLRYLPLPYPSSGTPDLWLRQGQQQVADGHASKRHLDMAYTMDRFVYKNLVECMHWRDRLGMMTAFCEDPVLTGMIHAKAAKGLRKKVRDAALEEAKKEALQAEQAGNKEELARSLIGPRGGLPPLRGDLIRLAVLLNVKVDPEDNVEMLKNKVRPIVQVLKEKPTPAPSKAKSKAKPAATKPQGWTVGYSAGLVAEPSPGMVSYQHLIDMRNRFQTTLDHMALEIQELRQQRQQGTQVDLSSLAKTVSSSSGSGGEMEVTPELLQDAAWSLEGAFEQQLAAHYGEENVMFLTPEERAEFFKEMEAHMNDETFFQVFDLMPTFHESLVNEKTNGSDPRPFLAEVYTTAQHVSKVARDRGHAVGPALSLETGWNFLLASHRERAKKQLAQDKPFCLVLAFPCGPFSPLQHLNTKGKLSWPRRLEEGRVLMRFALELADMQLKAGRRCIIENPKPSAAWREPEMRKFLEEKNVHMAVFDQCRFGLKSVEGIPQRKSTLVASSSSKVIDMLNGMEAVDAARHEQALRNTQSDGNQGWQAPQQPVLPETPVAAGNPSTPAFLPPSNATMNADENQLEGRDLPPVQPQELWQMMVPSNALASSQVDSSLPSRRASDFSDTPFPQATRLAMGRRPSGLPLTSVRERVREIEGSLKRPAELDAEALREQGHEQGTPRAEASSSTPAEVTEETLVTEAVDVIKAELKKENLHPLRRAFLQAELDKQSPLDAEVPDHGTWHGKWSLPSRSEWLAHQKLGLSWPNGSQPDHEVQAVQANRKEFQWRTMSSEEKKAFAEAAEQAWSVWEENAAIEVLTPEESERVRRRLLANKEGSKILTPRYVFTDRHEGLRTALNPLPLKARARVIVPGYKDIFSYSLRKDAPTGSRVSQHLLFTFTASHSTPTTPREQKWRIMSADVKSAFLKGDAYVDGQRELFLENVKGEEPKLPFGSCLAKIRKGVFGLSDAPRQWYLRLNKSLQAAGWERTVFDFACWLKWSDDRKKLRGIIISHVDDLLLGGDSTAQESLLTIGKELGFGSVEYDDFVYCGKRIQMQPDGAISVSMKAYHDNLSPVEIPLSRRKTPEAELSESERRQLRAVLGSLQWLVAQVRFDQGYSLSTLQGEKPVIGTLQKANQLVKEFKRRPDFSLVFQALDLSKAGIMVVSDSSLGNVLREGGCEGDVLEKLYSQSAYFVIIGDHNLMNGREGCFNVVDARSHRLPRVCRSTYGAELMGVEEGMDMGIFCRGGLATFLGLPTGRRDSLKVMEEIPMVSITDAKDTYDRGNSDCPTYGAQKSMAFAVAWVRQTLNGYNSSLKWTATANMWVDAGTKAMPLDHMQEILAKGKWSYVYHQDYVKQSPKKKTPEKIGMTAELPGEPLDERSQMFQFVLKLSGQPGWHERPDMAVHVAYGAKSFRVPDGRFGANKYPVRSTFGKFDLEDGRSVWRQLEHGGYAEVLAVLLEENVDVDHQLSTSIFTGLGALLAGYSLIHRYKETTLSTYAYHHQQATPLMCSLLTGAYEATAMLMAAGARTELRNGRGKSALDLALETGAPGFILCALRGDCDACERLLSGYIEVAARHVLSTERV